MKQKAITIFNNNPCDCDFEEERANIAECRECSPAEITDDDVWQSLNDSLDFWWHDCKQELDIDLDGEVICIADIGTWQGRRDSYKVLKSNLNEILNSFGCDYLKVYAEDGNIKARAVHHDGTNRYLFRMLKPFKTDEAYDRFFDRLWNGTLTDREMRRHTASLYPFVKKVYGWK